MISNVDLILFLAECTLLKIDVCIKSSMQYYLALKFFPISIIILFNLNLSVSIVVLKFNYDNNNSFILT